MVWNSFYGGSRLMGNLLYGTSMMKGSDLGQWIWKVSPSHEWNLLLLGLALFLSTSLHFQSRVFSFLSSQDFYLLLWGFVETLLSFPFPYTWITCLPIIEMSQEWGRTHCIHPSHNSLNSFVLASLPSFPFAEVPNIEVDCHDEKVWDSTIIEK